MVKLKKIYIAFLIGILIILSLGFIFRGNITEIILTDNADVNFPLDANIYIPDNMDDAILYFNVSKYRLNINPSMKTDGASDNIDFINDVRKTSNGDTYEDAYWDIDSIQQHTHNLNLNNVGIHEVGEIPDKVMLYIDNKLVDQVKPNEEIDITEYLNAENWHEIRLLPDGICRLEASIVIKHY